MLHKKIQTAWKKAKNNSEDCFDAVMALIEASELSERQKGYVDAELEEIGNCLSYESEDWIYEVVAVLKNIEEKN